MLWYTNLWTTILCSGVFFNNSRAFSPFFTAYPPSFILQNDTGWNYFLRPRGGNAEADMQSVLNALFSLMEHGSVCDEEKIDTAIQQIIDQQSFAYATLLYQLPSKQKELLVAICKEGKAMNLTSARFLKKYKLTSSSVQSAIRGLLEKDLVTNDLGTFSPYDLFSALWMRQQM